MISFANRTLQLFSKIPLIYFKVIFAVAAAIIISTFKFDLIEFYLFDLRTIVKSELGLSEIKNDKVALVLVTSKTVEKNNGNPSFNSHKLLIEKLAKIKQSQIVYNFRLEDKQFIEIKGNYSEKAAFNDYVKNLNNVFFITNNMTLKGQEKDLLLNIPLHNLKMKSAPLTIDTKFNSKNAISRRIVLTYENQILLHQEIASLYNPELKNKENIQGLYEHVGTEQAYINYHPRNSYPTYAFEDVLEGKVPESEFENKIILVGVQTNQHIEDYVATPYSYETKDLISTTELHANMFQTLIDNNAPKKAHQALNFIITLLICVLTVYVALSIKPSKGILILISTFLGFGFVSTLLLAFFDIWVNMAQPFIAIFLCYYFFIPYRLIIENRRSWEYLQKNKLLQQVEELKTNFISMMSHDLKTPIARIQGMTEVILKDEIQLSSTQREAVDTIKSSSDDLLKFINSILQYGRIESQGVELRKKSKDINQLLQDVIIKHEFLARIKRIKIKSELEPLFPIQVDSDLMRQVFSNLIENAIKYSHEDTSITIRSREEGNNLRVEVVDNGIGIPSEELPNIFMKFYRSQNVKTSTIKGTGLGLYLAHYFVHLHKGDILVISEHQKGSTFTVVLPLNS